MNPFVSLGGLQISTHAVFVALGVLAAAALLFLRSRRSGADPQLLLPLVTGALVGGAVGMRLAGLVRGVEAGDAATYALAWQYGAKSVLGGLAGAYAGVLVAKRLIGHRAPTGDLFAAPVALGMAIGRIGCLLGDPPGRPTSLPWGVYAAPELASAPGCPGCAAGVPLHPSMAYEIAFHVLAFAALMWWGSRMPAGLQLPVYLLAYGVFRFAVEFTRANELVAFGLTGSQLFLLLVLPLLVRRVARPPGEKHDAPRMIQEGRT